MGLEGCLYVVSFGWGLSHPPALSLLLFCFSEYILSLKNICFLLKFFLCNITQSACFFCLVDEIKIANIVKNWLKTCSMEVCNGHG